VKGRSGVKAGGGGTVDDNEAETDAVLLVLLDDDDSETAAVDATGVAERAGEELSAAAIPERRRSC
jgi:hypothetical protein